jgi:hypothetical protein
MDQPSHSLTFELEMHLGATENNCDEIVKAIKELKFTLQDQLKHQEKQMNTIMEEFYAFMKSSTVHVSFSRSKGENLSDGIAKIASDHDGSMGVVRNITYLIFLFLPSCDISCVVFLPISFLNQDFNYSKGMFVENSSSTS